MTSSDERNNRMEEIRNEYMRITGRARNEIRRRISLGLAPVQALTGLTQEILNGNFNSICSPPPPGSSVARRPSVIALRRVVNDLNAVIIRARISAAVPFSPALRLDSRESVLNLGNAVRNLEPAFSFPRLPNQRIVTVENRTYLRTLSSNYIQNLSHLANSCNRNTNQRERIQTPRKSANNRERAIPRRNPNEGERTIPRRNPNEGERTIPRRNTNEGERTLISRRNANERENTLPPRGIVRDSERRPFPGPLPRGIVKDSEKTPPPRPPPRIIAKNLERTPPPRPPPRTANNLERTLLSRRTVNDPERTLPSRRTANNPEITLPSRKTSNGRERIPFPRRVTNEPERTPPPRRTANDSGRTQFLRRTANDPERAPPDLLRPLDPNVPSYQYNPNTFDPSYLTWDQAITVMNFFNTDNDSEYKLIKRSFLRFSIKIYGLADCAKEDLDLEVFFFIERYFNIQPEIEISVPLERDHMKKNVVGVLFKRCAIAEQILARKHALNNTPYMVSRNDMCDWIIWHYTPDLDETDE